MRLNVNMFVFDPTECHPFATQDKLKKPFGLPPIRMTLNCVLKEALFHTFRQLEDGKPTDMASVRRVRAAVSDRPLWIGSGVTAETVREFLEIADGVIVGTALKRGGVTTAALDPIRVRAFLRAAGR